MTITALLRLCAKLLHHRILTNTAAVGAESLHICYAVLSPRWGELSVSGGHKRLLYYSTANHMSSAVTKPQRLQWLV
jgi:hypothetical protein